MSCESAKEVEPVLEQPKIEKKEVVKEKKAPEVMKCSHLLKNWIKIALSLICQAEKL